MTEMLKRYEAQGMMEWHPLLQAGRTRVRIPFTGGHLSGYGTTAASFETSDAAVQRLIEDSPHFKSGRIRLGARFATSGKARGATETHVTKEPAGVKETKRFATFEEATDWLSIDKRIPTSRLMTEEACRKEAMKLGVILQIGGVDPDNGVGNRKSP